MVRGIDIFREYFHEFKNQYVLIGGSACDLLFGEAGLPFRATKDLDVVLIVESLTPEFGRRFWDFITEGGYENRQRSTGIPQYYRFDKPSNSDYPHMIELFSRTEATLPDIAESNIVPVHIGEDISSLSAILLDEGYYQILLDGKNEVAEIVVLKPEILIIFKAKAYLDIKARREVQGLAINEDAKKHLKDVVRLIPLLTGNERPVLPEQIRKDMSAFIQLYEDDPYNPENIDVSVTISDFLSVMKKVFL